MRLLERISRQMSADIDLLLRQVDDPELTIFQLICDMEESIVDLRRETAATVARQNRLRTQLFKLEKAAGEVERKACLAVQAGQERRARLTLAARIGTLKGRDRLELELGDANARAAELVAVLLRLESRAQLARRKKDLMARRRQEAGSHRDVRVGEGGDAGHTPRRGAVSSAVLELEGMNAPATDSGGPFGWAPERRPVQGGGEC